MKKSVLAIFILFTGCQGVSTLAQYGEEQRIQERLTENQKKNFYVLAKDINDQKLVPGQGYKDILKKYGEPLFIKEEMTEEGLSVYRWVYKPYSKPFCNEMIYLYFNKDGNLVEVQYRGI